MLSKTFPNPTRHFRKRAEAEKYVLSILDDTFDNQYSYLIGVDDDGFYPIMLGSAENTLTNRELYRRGINLITR